jgi:hypothetical protein
MQGSALLVTISTETIFDPQAFVPIDGCSIPAESSGVLCFVEL